MVEHTQCIIIVVVVGNNTPLHYVRTITLSAQLSSTPFNCIYLIALIFLLYLIPCLQRYPSIVILCIINTISMNLNNSQYLYELQ